MSPFHCQGERSSEQDTKNRMRSVLHASSPIKHAAFHTCLLVVSLLVRNLAGNRWFAGAALFINSLSPLWVLVSMWIGKARGISGLGEKEEARPPRVSREQQQERKLYWKAKEENSRVTV